MQRNGGLDMRGSAVVDREQGHWVYVIVGIFATMVAIAFARMAYGVILPYMSESLSLSYKQSGLLGTLTSLGYVSLVLVAGVVSAKWGGKNTVVCGLLCITIGLFGMALTTNYPLTAGLMLLLGMGTAFTFATLVSLVTAWFPTKRGFVLGLVSSGVGIGSLLTGVLVPFLGDVYPDVGWRISWGLFAAVSILTLVMAVVFLKDPPSPANKTNEAKTTTRAEIWNIYKNPNVILVGLIYAITGCVHLVQAVFIMSFMIDSSLEAHIAGRLVALYGILSIFSGPIWGAVSDRVGRMNAIVITISLTFVAISLVVFTQSLFGFTAHMLLLSATIGGLFALVQAASLDQVENPKYMPVAFSYVTFYFATGQLIGPLVAGWVIEDLGGFTTAFVWLACLLAIGTALSIRLKIKSSKPRPSTAASGGKTIES